MTIRSQRLYRITPLRNNMFMLFKNKHNIKKNVTLTNFAYYKTKGDEY